jgi:hypothetical protein
MHYIEAQGDRSSLQALHAALLAVPSSVDQFRGKEFDAEAEVGHWTDLGSKLRCPIRSSDSKTTCHANKAFIRPRLRVCDMESFVAGGVYAGGWIRSTRALVQRWNITLGALRFCLGPR